MLKINILLVFSYYSMVAFSTMIKNNAQYNVREEEVRKQALRKLSVATSIKRFLELVHAGWSLVGPQPRPMPLSFAKLLSAKS